MNTVLLPVKDFKDSKQRLVASFDAVARAGLARAMLRDVLSVLAVARVPERVVVFTAAVEIAQMAKPSGHFQPAARWTVRPWSVVTKWPSGRKMGESISSG